jgi:hypothetical protein
MGIKIIIRYFFDTHNVLNKFSGAVDCVNQPETLPMTAHTVIRMDYLLIFLGVMLSQVIALPHDWTGN